MSRRPLIEYLKDPSLLSELTVEELKKWIGEVPYSQSLRRMLAMKTSKEDLEYDEALTDAALYSPDRARLKDFLNGTGQEREEIKEVSVREEPEAQEKKDEISHEEKVVINEELHNEYQEDIIDEEPSTDTEPEYGIDSTEEDADNTDGIDDRGEVEVVPTEEEMEPVIGEIQEDVIQTDLTVEEELENRDDISTEDLSTFSQWLLTMKRSVMYK